MDTVSYSLLMEYLHVLHQNKKKLMLVDSLTSSEIIQMDQETVWVKLLMLLVEYSQGIG